MSSIITPSKGVKIKPANNGKMSLGSYLRKFAAGNIGNSKNMRPVANADIIPIVEIRVTELFFKSMFLLLSDV